MQQFVGTQSHLNIGIINMKTIKRKSLLYKTEVEYGDYTINHVKGCAHGCLFPCYAFNMAKRFGNVKTYQEWIEPKLVSNALELLDAEIPKYKKDIKSVQLSFTTDPFMEQYPEVGELSIKIINRLNKDKIKAVILTKSVLPDSLLKTSRINEYGITLVSLDESFRQKYEPFTSRYEDSLKEIRYELRKSITSSLETSCSGISELTELIEISFL